MSYLEMLKNSQNTLNDPLPKVTEPPFGSFGSGSSMHFFKKKAPSANSLGNEPGQDADLPDVCPMLGGPVPDECRFDKKLFMRMTREGVLPIDGQCPLRRVCKLK